MYLNIFVCIVGLPYSLIICEHEIMCAYVSVYQCTKKIIYFQQNLYLQGVNKIVVVPLFKTLNTLYKIHMLKDGGRLG